MPNKGETVNFQNCYKQLQAPLVIYADFEAITKKVQSCKSNDDDSYTEAYQNHTDCSYAYKVVCCYDDMFSKPVESYRSENAVYISLWKKCWMKYDIVRTQLKSISINR